MSITKGVSDILQKLWKERDYAETEKEKIKAQRKIDDYFLPKKEKTHRKKPKKKYAEED